MPQRDLRSPEPTDEPVRLASLLCTEMRSGALADVDLPVEVSGPDVTVDLRDVPYLDCVALGALMEAEDRLRGAGVRLRLRGANPRVQRVLDITDLPDSAAPDPSAPPNVVLF
jgi:hypothetical protein